MTRPGVPALQRLLASRPSLRPRSFIGPARRLSPLQQRFSSDTTFSRLRSQTTSGQEKPAANPTAAVTEKLNNISNDLRSWTIKASTAVNDPKWKSAGQLDEISSKLQDVKKKYSSMDQDIYQRLLRESGIPDTVQKMEALWNPPSASDLRARFLELSQEWHKLGTAIRNREMAIEKIAKAEKKKRRDGERLRPSAEDWAVFFVLFFSFCFAVYFFKRWFEMAADTKELKRDLKRFRAAQARYVATWST